MANRTKWMAWFWLAVLRLALAISLGWALASRIGQQYQAFARMLRSIR